MRKSNNDNFFLAYFLNLILNIEWIIPSVILLVLHLWLKVPIFLFWIALGLWLGGTLIVTLLLLLIRKSVEPDEHHENRNPYSATNDSVFSHVKNKNGN